MEEKRSTINESKFVEDLEKIIERDFYPDLDALKLQKDYYDALERNDVAKLREIQMKMQPPGSTQRNLSVTPLTFDTPEIADSSPGPGKRKTTDIDDLTLSNPEPPKKRLSSDLHLDQYLSNYASEDDVALKQLMEESERQTRIRRPWLFNSSEVEKKKAENLLALPDPAAQAAALDDKQANRDLVTWKHESMNAVMFIPDGAPLSEKEMLEVASRKPRAVLYENTRFKVSTTIGVNRPSTSVFANKLEGRIGIDGREVIAHNTPGVGGYKYVSTPSPAPGAMGESPFMTWGQVDSTPVLVDPSATPLTAPAFKIPDVPEREQLALDLAERASRNNRAKKQTALKTAADSVRRYASPSQRIASMSPAAQKFLVRQSTDSGLRATYTPSPLSSLTRTPKTPSSITPSSIRILHEKGTPVRSSAGPSSSSSSTQKPSGPQKAEDFF